MNQIHPIAVEGERLDRTERLIVALMGDLLRATPVTFDAVIDRVLAEIGQTCGFDRTYVILHRGGGVYDNTHEWCAAGIEPAKPLLQGAQIDLSPAWAADFDRDLPHFVPDVASLDADDPMTAFLQAQGIRSLMVVPLTDGQRYMGILGYDMVQTHRPMSEKERFLLASLARGVAAVIQRVETEAAMRRTQNALEDARSQMSATLAAIPDLILELDGDGRYTACHSSGVALLAPVDRIVGQLVEDVVPPDVASIARTIMREVDGTGRSGTYRYSLDIPGEGLRWYEVRGARRANQGGRDSYITIVRDITEREEAQAKATAREAMMRGLFEMSPLGIVLADPDTGRVVEANAAFLTQTGLNRGALRHVTMLDLVHPDFRDLAVQAADEVRDQGRFGPYETRYIRKDGSSFPAVVRGFMVQDPAGGRVVCRVIEDVAVARAQRAALEERTAEATEARRRLIAAVNALHDGFAIFDAEDRLLMSNARFVSIFAPAKVRVYPGVPYGALVQAGLTHGLFPAADGRESAFLEEMLHLKDGRRSEHDLDLSDGRTLRILSQPSPDGGRVELYVDVTALRRSEQHLENIVAGARVGTWEWDVETGENRINDRWAEMLGTTRAALGDLRIEVWRNLVHPDDMPRMQDTLQRVMGGELAQFDYTLRLRHADGRWVWVQSRGQVLARTPDGRPALMAGVHLDVTALRDTEARLEATIDGARVGTWEHEAATGMSFINDRWAQMLGYAAQDLQPVTAERFQALAHPDDFAVLTASEAASFARGDYSTEHEIRLRHRDGHWVWVLSRGRVRSFNADGTPAWLTGVHIDITARKELEMALQRERDTITRLMETSVSGIVAFDKDGRIIFANAAAEVAVGRDLRSLLGQAYDAADWGMTHLDGRPIARAERPIHRVLTGGETLRDFRFALTDHDGTRRVISLNAAALRGPGIDPAVVCTVSDITRMLEDEARLRAALERAEAGSRAKSQFLATMSHEIRTPLNGVLGTAELLAPLMVTDEKREMVTTIRKSGELLLTILNDILDLAKIESGRVDIERRPFRPADTLRDVVDLHWATADAKGVVLSLEVGAGAQGWRLGDGLRLNQVVNNLVSNAVKFTESGAVTVALAGTVDGLSIQVTDTGIGMTPDQLRLVFDEFTQADGSITRRFGGTGLGLAIARGLVGQMGGRIDVTSEPGVGTRFVVDLALPVADAAPGAPAGAAIADLAGLHVLVAEDNATNRVILITMLKKLGITAVQAPDGQAAVDAWLKAPPDAFDALLLDISMPRLDGLGALQAIRAAAEAAGFAMPPAVAVTANAMTHDLEGYLAAGFAACVAKPLSLGPLAATLAHVTGARTAEVTGQADAQPTAAMPQV